MGLRIRTNVPSLKANRHLSNTTHALKESTEKLSSGYRINKSADDAAGLAISETLRAKIRSTEQARRNAMDGISLIQVAEGSMNEITNIIIRLRELTTQASSDTIGNLERSYANKEYVQLVDEIERITNSSEFNGIQLLKGADANGFEQMSIHVDAGDGTIENTDTITLNIENIKIDAAEGLGLGKEAEIGPVAVDDDFSREDAAIKLTTLDNALKTIAGNRAILGSKQSRLGSTINNLGIKLENMNIAKSRIKDVDVASEMAEYTRQSILGQAGISVLTNANQMPRMALNLLQ